MSTEVRVRTVLAVLSGRQTVADAAAQLGVTRQTIYNWRAAFIAGGSASLGEGSDGSGGTPSEDRTTSRVEAVVVAVVTRLRRLNDTNELDMATLEAIRIGAGVPVSRFYARRALPVEAPAAPAQQRIDAALADVRARHPAWGARRIWRHLTEVGGADVSLATVKRALARLILTEARHMSS